MSKFKVSLWPGAGYWIEFVEVEAAHAEEALILASKEIGFSIPSDEADDEIESSDQYTYLDRTEYGIGNIYLLIENAVIEELN